MSSKSRRRGVRDPRRAHRPGPDPATGGRRHPDHAQHDVRPGRRRRPQGIRVLAQRQPHPRRARKRASHRSKAPATAWPSPAGWPPKTTCCACCRPGDRVLLGNDAYGGTFRLISKVHTGLTWTAVDLIDTDRLVADWPDDTKLVWLETPTNPLLRCFDIERSATSPTPVARWCASTTPSPRRSCSSRCRSAPTSSCTRPPSTSVGTATWSAASWPSTTTTSPSG